MKSISKLLTLAQKETIAVLSDDTLDSLNQHITIVQYALHNDYPKIVLTHRVYGMLLLVANHLPEVRRFLILLGYDRICTDSTNDYIEFVKESV